MKVQAERQRKLARAFGHALVLGLHVGCAAPSPLTQAVVPAQQATPPTPSCPSEGSAELQQVVHREEVDSGNQQIPPEGTREQPEPLPPPTPVRSAQSCEIPNPAPFAGLSELSAEALVEQVLARNPTLAQMVAAWQAASARYPQVTSLDDPMLGVTLGPASFFSDRVNPAYRLEIAQKYPWCGKLQLRGENALANASAAGNDVDDARLQLVEAARLALSDYYLVARAIGVNEEALRLLREFRENAEVRYRTGLTPQQDILQADVEIGRQRKRGVNLERMRVVAVARINTLMNREPDAPLPPAPKELPAREELPGDPELRRVALARRPDLQALKNRIDAEQAALGLARKEYCPDFEPFLMYDRFMGNNADNQALAWMTGVRMNLPVRLARRQGAVDEAQARLAERSAELADRVNRVNYEVQQAAAEVVESRRVVKLYEETILPAARNNVKSAQTAYTTGKIPFLSLIEAERSLVGLLDESYEAVADYFRRRATLERVIGGPLLPPDAGPSHSHAR